MFWSAIIIGLCSYYVYQLYISKIQNRYLLRSYDPITEDYDEYYDHYILRQFAIPVLRLLCVLTLIGYLIEYYEQYLIISASIEVYKSRTPPFNCGYGALTLEDLGYLHRMQILMGLDNSEDECMEYLSKLHQTPWPNPVEVFVEMFTKVFIAPIRIMINILPTAFFARILLIVFLLGMFAIYWFGQFGILQYFLHKTKKQIIPTPVGGDEAQKNF